MSLIRQISAIPGAGYGINILEVNPPTQAQGVGTDVVAAVGELPWGPPGVPTKVSGAGLFATFSPLVFGVEADVPALKAFMGKTFPSLIEVVRVDATGALPADFTFAGAGAVDSVDVTARGNGAVGNLISVEWVANADTATNADAIVTVTPAGATDPSYSVRYLNVAVAGAPIQVNDPGDPLVEFAVAAGSPAVVPTLPTAATALTGGADGTAVAGDYTAAIEALSDVNVDWNVAFVAEPPEALIAGINTSIKSFVDTHSRGIWVLCSAAAETSSAAEADAALHRSDRIMKPWPKVKTVNKFSPSQSVITVDGNSFMAVATASVPPERSPGGAGGAAFLRGIVGLVSGASDAEYESMSEAGVAPFLMSRRFEGAIIRRAVTTSVISVDARRVFRRRMTDYIAESVADTLALYTELPLDIDISSRILGPITGPEIGTIVQFLDGLRETGRVRGYSIDPFSSNLQSNIDAGQWIIDMRTKYNSMQEEIILQLQAGTTVIINEAA